MAIRATAIVAAVIAAALLGAAVANSLKLAGLALCAAAGLLTVNVLVARPDLASRFAFITLALIPLGGLPLFGIVHPAVVILFLIAALAAFMGSGLSNLRPTLVDLGVAMIATAILVSVVAGKHRWTDALPVLGLWMAPYIAGRLVVSRFGVRVALEALALAGLAALPFAVVEALGGPNVLLDVFSWGRRGQDQIGFGDALIRFGRERTQGSQGHPILFAVFLCMAAVASLGLWLERDSGPRWYRWMWLPAMFLVVLQITTISRTGYLILVVTGALVLVSSVRSLLRGRNLALVPIGLLAIAVVFAVPQSRNLLLGSGGNSSEQKRVEQSSQYRSQLLREAVRPGFIAPLGTSETLVGPGGLRSVDNAYLLTAWRWGYLSLLGFALVFVGLCVKLRSAIRMSSEYVLQSLAIAVMVAFTGVALFGQIPVVVFFVFGAAAGGVGRRRHPAGTALSGYQRSRYGVGSVSYALNPDLERGQIS